MIVRLDSDMAAQNSRTRVKVCGLTRAEDAERAVEVGADALGVVFADSPRQVDVKQAYGVLETTPGYVQRVGVFADQPIELIREAITECRLDWIQLSGNESADLARSIALPVIKAIHVSETYDLEKGKDYPGDRRAVERAILDEDVISESLSHPRQHRAPR